MVDHCNDATHFCADDPLPPPGGSSGYDMFAQNNLRHPGFCDAKAALGDLCGTATLTNKPCVGQHAEPVGQHDNIDWVWNFEASSDSDIVACIGQGGGVAPAQYKCGHLKRDGEMCDGDNTPVTNDWAFRYSATVGYNEQCPLGSCDAGAAGVCSVATNCALDTDCGHVKNCVGASSGTGTCLKKCSEWQRQVGTEDSHGNCRHACAIVQCDGETKDNGNYVATEYCEDDDSCEL